MTEEQALDRVSEIGSAFANDLNDGDGDVLYEGVYIATNDHGRSVLIYKATMENGTEVEWRWPLAMGNEA